MRPVAGVIDGTFEVIETLDVGLARIRETAGREHDELRLNRCAVGRRHRPAPRTLVEHRALDVGVELDVPAQIKPVSDVVGVFQNLRLRCVALAPVPFLLELFRERIGILHALDVATRTGIAIPVPGAADAAALLVDSRRETEPAQTVQHVHAGETRADDDHVVGFRGRRRIRLRWRHRLALPRCFLLLWASIRSRIRKRKGQIGRL
ncbi:hypothetical protein ACVWZZ_007136 [Bradyrhizobium sp. LM6.10]